MFTDVADCRRSQHVNHHPGNDRRHACAWVVHLGLVVSAWSAAPSALASQTQVHIAEGRDALLRGTFDGATLTPAGQITAGTTVRTLGEGLDGPVLALTRGGDGALYAATGAPGRVWRIAEGKAPEKIYEDGAPLITALLPLAPNMLVALTAPNGGAVRIDLATKKTSTVPCPQAELLLGGAVVDGTVYAVGGGEEGVLLRLAPKGEAFEVVARTKEAQLRSVAVASQAGAPRVVVGGGADGVVYELVGTKLRALLDAAPAEVSALVIGADGVVYAAMVDAEGKLTAGAPARATEGSESDKKPSPRKVKGTEVWRIDTAGHAALLWQSRDHGAYALALTELPDASGKKASALLVGTGPEGRVYHLGPAGGSSAGIYARVRNHDEVTALRVDNGGLVLGTAHAPAVLLASATPASLGEWTSEALDAEGLARYGRVTARGRGDIRLTVRSGNTKEADDTWSEWTSATTAVPAGRYAQVRATVASGAMLDGVSLAYLLDNRPPEVARVDVLAPGWKVVAGTMEGGEVRSVSFGEKPFGRFLDRRGGQHPTGDERALNGKQSFDLGYRTVYAYAEDPDRDALRYRFFLGRAGADGSVKVWTALKEWSDHPFVSFEASRLTDGDYRVRVEVDDLPTNGPARHRADSEESSVFVVSHAVPVVSAVSAARAGANAVRVRFDVRAALPLTAVRCSTGGADWVPLDAADGIVDGPVEKFDVVLDIGTTDGALRAVSCEVYDEALNFGRVDVPIAK